MVSVGDIITRGVERFAVMDVRRSPHHIPPETTHATMYAMGQDIVINWTAAKGIFSAGDREANLLDIDGTVVTVSLKPIPKFRLPGSQEAKLEGCNCPVADNAFEAPTSEAPASISSFRFVFRNDCPVHGTDLTPDEPFSLRTLWDHVKET